MNITVNDLLLILGQKEVELAILRSELQVLKEKLNDFQSPESPIPPEDGGDGDSPD